MFTVRAASADEATEVATLCAQAFEDEPYWHALMPRTSRRFAFIHRSFLKDLEHGGINSLDVAVHENSGRIVGALRWEAPQLHPDDQDPALRRSQDSWQAIKALFSFGAWHDLTMQRYRPQEPHWALHEIAAHPELRGLGIESALLTHRLARMDHAPAPVVLEATSAASVQLHKQFGFRAVAKVAELPGTSCSVMIRPCGARKPQL